MFYYQNYSQHCQGDLLECHRHTTWNGSQKYSPLKEKNQWHKSYIVQSSLVSCTIPLYCVFIIPLNWIYGVGQVERSHAWTFLTVCFVESKRGASIDIHGTTSMRCDSIFFVNPWVYMLIPEQHRTSLCLREGSPAPPSHLPFCRLPYNRKM